MQVLREAGYKVEVAYNLAPENDKAGGFPGNVNRVVQFGQHPNAPWDEKDRVAPQSEQGIPGAERAYTPNSSAAGPAASHLVANYEWIFDRREGQEGYIAPSQNNPPRTPLIDKDAKFTPPSTNVNAKDNK